MNEAVRTYGPLQTRHIISMEIGRRDLAVIYRDAQKACLGGRSRVRTGDRKEFLGEDQMVGLIGNYALALWKDGDPRAYMDQRHSQNRFSDKGDGGFDLPRVKFDIKTSMMRRSQDPLQYNLPVRPKERHVGWAYGLALVEKFSIEGLKENPAVHVHLVGWATDDELPKAPNGVGKLEGAFTISAKDLHPFTPLTYDGKQ